MSEQLAPIVGNVRKTRDMTLPSLNFIGEDGVDHINVWEYAKTSLGKALNHLADMPFKHDIYGKFHSMEAFWYYIRSKSGDDQIRQMSGFRARRFGMNLEAKKVKDFRAVIADANWQKIKAYPLLKQELKELLLPIDAYYINNPELNVRIRPVSSMWLVPALHEIRVALQEEREPDFSFLTDEEQNIGIDRYENKKTNRTGFNSHLQNIYSVKPPQKKKQNGALLAPVSPNKPKPDLQAIEESTASLTGSCYTNASITGVIQSESEHIQALIADQAAAAKEMNESVEEPPKPQTAE